MQFSGKLHGFSVHIPKHDCSSKYGSIWNRSVILAAVYTSWNNGQIILIFSNVLITQIVSCTLLTPSDQFFYTHPIGLSVADIYCDFGDDGESEGRERLEARVRKPEGFRAHPRFADTVANSLSWVTHWNSNTEAWTSFSAIEVRIKNVKYT